LQGKTGCDAQSRTIPVRSGEPGGRPVVSECQWTLLGSASGRAFSPTQGFRFI
jgi:hypothetical protein